MPVITTPVTARDRSLDLKSDGQDSGRTDPESQLWRDVVEAAGDSLRS
jgi:hypothetical protein